MVGHRLMDKHLETISINEYSAWDSLVNKQGTLASDLGHREVADQGLLIAKYKIEKGGGQSNLSKYSEKRYPENKEHQVPYPDTHGAQDVRYQV